VKKQTTIDFTKNAKKLFSTVFYEIRKAKTDYVVVKGGSGSSKSYSVHQSELLNIMTSKEGDTLVLRKHGADLRESCYKLFNDLIDKYCLRQYFKSVYSNDQRKIIYMPTGRALLFRGLDDSEKVKSIVGIKRVVMEEASEFELEDFLELTRRARGFDDIQFILILNPISENHWIKTTLCDDNAPYRKSTTVFSFTYLDNKDGYGNSFLTDKDIERLQNLKLINENQYNIYVLGLWGIENKEGKFCWAFHSGQIKQTIHEPERITWATFDFNRNPMTCTIAQIIPEEQTLRAIECIKLDNSNIWEMCDRLVASYPEALWMVTGDATGQSGSAMVQDNMNYYKIIIQKLQINEQQVKIPTKNPPIEENQLLVNAVHKNWNIEIDPDRCQPLIYDLTYVEMNAYGEIVKDRSSAKKFADFLDGWRYIINIGVRPYLNFMQ